MPATRKRLRQFKARCQVLMLSDIPALNGVQNGAPQGVVVVCVGRKSGSNERAAHTLNARLKALMRRAKMKRVVDSRERRLTA